MKIEKKDIKSVYKIRLGLYGKLNRVVLLKKLA